jgi:two-component system, OmpR family, response regulator
MRKARPVYATRIMNARNPGLSILLVEDDPQLAAALCRALESEGWHVDHTARGEQAVTSVARDLYDAMVLDVSLIGIDGFEVLRRIRLLAKCPPVLMLTARDAIEDRVRGLEGGANDYLVKPFALPELIARLRAMTRSVRAEHEAVIQLGQLTLHRLDRRAYIDGVALDLSAREWSVLEYLLPRAGRVVDKEQIGHAVVGNDEALTENAVEVYISRLRAKLQPAGIAIRSIRGFGYLMEVKAEVNVGK